ncbi:hypothetical protein M7I_4558 [Glarea lozoyensis 74030]|uniref:Uncharacterized protein n=1 Tax=Glarea lozoyensis (strain ATCC 74030 / MF5533) TaxID=1104152 RepID=H0EPH9_GLAL7|nr:hypothetical protein M7I_4558 [Glarea lozoyensis 74030]
MRFAFYRFIIIIHVVINFVSAIIIFCCVILRQGRGSIVWLVVIVGRGLILHHLNHLKYICNSSEGMQTNIHGERIVNDGKAVVHQESPVHAVNISQPHQIDKLQEIQIQFRVLDSRYGIESLDELREWDQRKPILPIFGEEVL